MIISLLLGIILGGVTVIFALQNTAVVTVAFLTWQITAPLALLLLACMLGGIAIVLLILLPFLIRDEMTSRRLKKEKQILEADYARYREAHPAPATPAAQPVVY